MIKLYETIYIFSNFSFEILSSQNSNLNNFVHYFIIALQLKSGTVFGLLKKLSKLRISSLKVQLVEDIKWFLESYPDLL